MDRETAIRKVLRCLRLAASSNPNEAATALRQARAMMAEYGLTEADAYASEIHDADAATRCRGATPTRSMMALIDVVERVFRCKVILVRSQEWSGFRVVSKTTLRFFGAGSDAQVAAYAFTVLRRQLEADKARHTCRIRVRKNKEARGEEFAIGWVVAVSMQFPVEALPDDRAAAIDAAVASKHSSLTTLRGREVGKGVRTNGNDREAGYIAGKNAKLHPGVAGTVQRQLPAGGAT